MKCYMINQLSIFIFIIISFATCDEINYLKIPLVYYPFHNYNDSSPSKIMDNIIDQRLYARINIGTPKAEIDLALLFDANEFFINPGKDNSISKEFNDFKFYKNNESSTNNDSSEEICPDISIYVDYFQFANCKQDIFYFNNKEATITFYEVLDSSVKLPGGLGLLLNPLKEEYETNCPRNQSFFEKAKKKGLISSYDWSIFFNSKDYKKEETGFLLMGCTPNETNSDLGYYKKGDFYEKYKNNTDIFYPNLEILLNKVLIYNGTNKSDIIYNEDNLKIKFEFNNGGILSPNKYLKYFEEAFKDYIANKICYKENIYLFTSSVFFYCKKEIGDDIKKIKEKFPIINFQSVNLYYDFIIEADDLFVEQGDYIFCLLFFGLYEPEWKIGKPFLKKYQFSFNYDKKKLYFYQHPPEEEAKNNSGVPLYVLILSVVGACIVMALISFLLFKFYFYDKCVRKKRANELTDDDYEYTAKEDEQKNQEVQQNNDENDNLGINSN